ncbi:MAG: hypothetical protein AAF570_28335, partial [Bacteroidota bacterium]
MPVQNLRTYNAHCLAFLFFYLLISTSLSAQTVTSCTPNSAPAGSSVSVSITGTGVDFNAATPIADMMPAVGPTIFANSWNVTSDTTMTAD